MEITDNLTISKLTEKYNDQITEMTKFRNEITVCIRPDKLIEILQYLRDENALGYNFLADLTAVDKYQESPRFEIVYHLRSLKYNFFIRIKTSIQDNQKIPSVSSLWQTADWLEREVYDLFGIEFENHPDLRRILTPNHWEDHPLRKDYPLTGKNEPLYYQSEEDVEDSEL